MAPQRTLRQSAQYSGTGLHSGNSVTIQFHPAAANSGLRFRRVDLDGRPEIEARIENVSDTTRSTTLSKGNIRIHTVEHVLAAFAGYGIDNAVIELDSNEPPIGDGSARPFCELIRRAGIEDLLEKRDTYSVQTPVEIQVGEASIAVFPHDCMKISCTSADKNGRFTQFFSLEVDPETWERELASARTFCFYEEIEFLIKNGLIKGGSLENAVVIREDAVLTTEPLRYPEEFVRHKILDILGDLALFGRPLQAHIVAIKPSHAANCELARQLHSQMRKQSNPPPVAARTFLPAGAETSRVPSTTPGGEGQGSAGMAMNIEDIMRALPHRHPFLMVDRVVRIEENKIVGLKNVSINEAYFQGHFPNHPIMPGVLQLEAIAQVAGILMLTQQENAGKIAYFMSAERVKWRKPVRPGDQLMIQVELTKARGKIGKGKGVCTVDGEIVSEGEVTFMLMDA